MRIPRIIIWGLGYKFQSIWTEFKFMQISGMVEIVAFVDKAGKYEKFDDKPVIYPYKLLDIDFDYLVTASFDHANDMREEAIKLGISPEKIMSPYMFLWKGFSHEYKFIDRQSGQEDCLIVLAGWHPILWNNVFKRIEAFLPEYIDVCVVVSGTESSWLEEICEKNSWSYLETKEDKLALAQNLAIDLHPKANYIYKIDEDVFITENFFSGLKETYQEVMDTKVYQVGFVAPVLNINGWGYRKFLDIKGKLAEYEEHFGPAYKCCTGIPAILDSMAAKYLWELTFPLDLSAKQMQSCREPFSACWHRFSIGAIMILRDVWETMGGFRVSETDGILGLEEAELCKFCMDRSLAIICANRVLVGHLCFGPQRDFMDQYYVENEEKFGIQQ